MTKLKYKIVLGRKVYTLEDSKKTKDAHYKFKKVRDAPKSDSKYFSK